MTIDYDRLLEMSLSNYADSLLDHFRRTTEWYERMYPEKVAERKRLEAIGPVHGPKPVPVTVAELIRRLQEMPQDAEVWTSDSEYGSEAVMVDDDLPYENEGRVWL